MSTLRNEKFSANIKDDTSSFARELSNGKSHDLNIAVPVEERDLEHRSSKGCDRDGNERNERQDTDSFGLTLDDNPNINFRKSEVAGHRLYLQTQENEQSKETLRQKASLTADSKHSKNQVTADDNEFDNGRITALYELGKNRVAVNRELAASRTKVETLIDIQSVRTSERIDALYELGKNRVVTNRELAAAKFLTIDNRAANVAALSDTKASVSEIAGHRLYIQAKQSEEKKENIRKVARTAPLPQMELATQQRSPRNSIDRGTSPIERFFSLYQQGKNRVIADRELAMIASDNKADLHDEGIIAEHANMRQIELYEMGKDRLLNERLNKNQERLCNEEIFAGHANVRQIELYKKGTQKLISKRLNEKQHIDNMNEDILSSRLSTTIDANSRMMKLYEMSKEMQEDGKARREEIIRGTEQIHMNTDNHLVSSLSKESSPNATMTKLYAMSKLMQDYGKERRDEIRHAKVIYPVMKV